MANFETRAGGDTVGNSRNRKQSMADLKLRRLAELNLRLREDLDRPRVKVSEAAMGWVAYHHCCGDHLYGLQLLTMFTSD
jgi:guanine nucleotide-binding protein subunit gamma